MHRNTKGFLWNLSENMVVQIIQFTIGVIMARILTPSDYGLVGILYVYIAISTAVMNGGFSAALIQNTKRTEVDFSTAFYFNIVVSIVFALLLCLLSPQIAMFYHQPQLETLTKIMAIPLVINALNLVQRTRFTIQLNFKILAKIGIIASLAQGTCGIYMAYNEYGVASIAWAGVWGAAINCVLCWCASRWIPRGGFSLAAFKRMFNYGSKLLLSSLLDTIWNNIYPLIIGKSFPPASLGYFTRAHNYAALPVTTITDVIGRVTFPILSELQHDKEKLQTSYNDMLRMTAFFVFPLMMGIATLSKPLVLLMLTEKWESCVPYLQILCLAMMFYPINALNLNLLKVIGRSDLFLKLEVWKKVVSVIVMVITIPLGIKAICWGILALSVLCLAFNTHYTGKFLKLGILKQLMIFKSIMLISCAMAAFVWGISTLLHSYVLQLVIGGLCGAAIYYAAVRMFIPATLQGVVNVVKSK